MSKREAGGRTRALAGAALALAALGGAATAGPAAALGRVCPPSTPNCDPEAVPGDAESLSGYGGIGPAAIGGICRPSSPNCGPET